MRLLLDEMISPAIARQLRDRGFEVDAVKRDRPELEALPAGSVTTEGGTTMGVMAVAAKKLSIGDLVEIGGRQCDVVSDKAGGVALEPAITVFSDELHKRHGTRPATEAEFERMFGNLPEDGEG